MSRDLDVFYSQLICLMGVFMCAYSRYPYLNSSLEIELPPAAPSQLVRWHNQLECERLMRLVREVNNLHSKIERRMRVKPPPAIQ